MPTLSCSSDSNKSPITLAELNTRGLRIDDEHIIYTFPDTRNCASEKATFRVPNLLVKSQRRIAQAKRFVIGSEEKRHPQFITMNSIPTVTFAFFNKAPKMSFS
ncbi:hypothetical protein COOONC_01962 [Cooperia oncophora]